MALLKNTYKGNTLIETIIALTIICICFFIGTDIIVNITRSRKHLQKVEYTFTGHKLINETIINKTFHDETFSFKNYYVKKNCVIKGEKEKATIIKLEFYDNNDQQIYTLSKWIPLEK